MNQPARHKGNTASIVNNLVERNIGEAPKHELHHWAQPKHGRSDSHPNEASLADGCVDYPAITMLFPESLSNFVRAIILSDLFADNDDIFVAENFFIERRAQRFPVSYFRHCSMSVVEEVSPTRRFGLVVHLPVDIRVDIIQLWVGTFFGEF